MLREYRFLLPYLRRYRAAYLLGGTCILLSVALKLWIPRLLGNAFDELHRLAREEQQGLSGVDPEQIASLVARAALTIALLALAVAVVRTTSRLAILGTCRRVAHDLRNRLFDHLLRLAPSFYVRNPTGQILSRCINDMQNVQGLMGPVILYLAETLVLFAIAITMMARIDPLLTGLALLPFPAFLVYARRLARRIQEGSRAAQNSLGEVAAKVDETLSGQLVVKTLVLEQRERERFERHCLDYRRLNLGVTRDRAWLIAAMTLLSSVSALLVLAVGGGGRGPDVSIGELVSLFLYLGMLASPTRTLGFVISSLRRGGAALGRIREVLDSEVTLVDPPGEEAQAAPELQGEIELCHLTVEYPPLADQPHLSGSLPTLPGGGGDRARRVLDDVSLVVPAGATLGIVGPVGSGKTTLVRAVARQLEVPPGAVLLDGRDVTALPLAAVRRQVGFVPQDAFLFSTTLAANLALGREDAAREELFTAAAGSQLAKDLDQLPQGLETLVGERGVTLSGGQRQRAALARVLLLAPRVLILDDTLSAVDTETADQILEHLRPFMAGRTTLIVAHRLSTVRHADRIVVLEDGRIVESGTHDELLELGGRYARTWARQERQARRAERAHELERELELDPGEGRG